MIFLQNKNEANIRMQHYTYFDTMLVFKYFPRKFSLLDLIHFHLIFSLSHLNVSPYPNAEIYYELYFSSTIIHNPKTIQNLFRCRTLFQEWIISIAKMAYVSHILPVCYTKNTGTSCRLNNYPKWIIHHSNLNS